MVWISVLMIQNDLSHSHSFLHIDFLFVWLVKTIRFKKLDIADYVFGKECRKYGFFNYSPFLYLMALTKFSKWLSLTFVLSISKIDKTFIKADKDFLHDKSWFYWFPSLFILILMFLPLKKQLSKHIVFFLLKKWCKKLRIFVNLWFRCIDSF